MSGDTQPCRNKRPYRLSAQGRARIAAAAAERMRKLHADPEFKAKHRELAAERMRKLNADPEFKAATAERMRKLHADPEFNPLAGLSHVQRKVYQKLRANGIARDEALAEAKKPTRESA